MTRRGHAPDKFQLRLERCRKLPGGPQTIFGPNGPRLPPLTPQGASRRSKEILDLGVTVRLHVRMIITESATRLTY